MKVYTLDLDSGERDPTLHPDPNSFGVTLKTPIYDVSNLEIVSARVPTPLSPVSDYNKTFTVRIDAGAPDAGDYECSLEVSNISTTSALTTIVSNAFTDAGITTVDEITFSDDTQSLVFSNAAGTEEFTFLFHTGTNGWASNVFDRTTPNQFLGLKAVDVSSVGGTIDLGGRVDLKSNPKTYVFKITAGSEEFTQDAYTNMPFYTGVFMGKGTVDDGCINLYSEEDVVEHAFTKGTQRAIHTLKIELFHKENNKLVPADLRSRDYAMKLRVTGNTDKLENLPKITEEDRLGLCLPPPVHIPELVKRKNLKRWDQYIPIVVIVIIGVVLMISLSDRPRTPAPPAS
jgi:hypothetical protein